MSLLLVLQLIMSESTLPAAFYLCTVLLLLFSAIKLRLTTLNFHSKLKKILELKAEYWEFVELVDYFIQLYRENSKRTNV
jgi:hypothetical protein